MILLCETDCQSFFTTSSIPQSPQHPFSVQYFQLILTAIQEMMNLLIYLPQKKIVEETQKSPSIVFEIAEKILVFCIKTTQNDPIFYDTRRAKTQSTKKGKYFCT
jgi:hypothetical protein